MLVNHGAVRNDGEIVVTEVKSSQPITGPRTCGRQGRNLVVREIENIQASQFGDVGRNGVNVVVCEVQVL